MKKVIGRQPAGSRSSYWGKAELTSTVKSTDGKPLRAILVKPENFDPSKKYPMMVYIYERLSQDLHSFRAPASRRAGHQPDVLRQQRLPRADAGHRLQGRHPGPERVKCVLPAIQAVVDKGFVDEKAIGIKGQSWGGYQIAYMVTQTDRFKAAVAGAPVSNMISAYDGIRWGTGLPRQFQYEQTQSRIGGDAVGGADQVHRELAGLHGRPREDAAADASTTTRTTRCRGTRGSSTTWRCGGWARRSTCSNYNGEPHGLRNRDNEALHRADEFFDHHLHGKPTPEWMEKGVPFLEKGKRDVSDMFKMKPAPRATTESAAKETP